MNGPLPEIGLPKARTMGSHQSASAKTHTWLTPPYIIEALGPFGLDPCAAPTPRPWPTAATHWTREDQPLHREWSGRVWLNPPFGPEAVVAASCAAALLFARTADDGDFICEGCGAVVIGDPHYLPGEQIAYCADCLIKEEGSDE